MAPDMPIGVRQRIYRASLYYDLVTAAKVRILQEALRRHGGNRTHAARALGVQRTYLLRLIRQLEIKA